MKIAVLHINAQTQQQYELLTDNFIPQFVWK